MNHRLLGSPRPLSEIHDVALLDLDGVVYLGEHPVEGAPDALAAVRRRGMRLAFVTNNASRTPQAVASRLTAMGVPADAHEVTTSAQAAAHALADRLPAGAAVLVVGGEGLWAALRERGLEPTGAAVDGSGHTVAAVVQGFAVDVGWSMLAEAAVAIRGGALWLATNLDRTVPSERGPLPGNGSLVHALGYATGATPESTGKPDPTMHRESVERSGAMRPVVVGDRLDTDIAGAVRAGAPSLLVLSGVTDANVLLAAAAAERPDHVARDVAGLEQVHPEVEWDAAVSRRVLGRWEARVAGDEVRLVRTGPDDAGGQPGSGDDAIDALRLVTPAVWRCRDRLGEESTPSGGSLVACDAEAEAVLQEWRVDGFRTWSGV